MNYDKEIKSLKLFNEKSIKLDRLKILKMLKKLDSVLILLIRMVELLIKQKGMAQIQSR